MIGCKILPSHLGELLLPGLDPAPVDLDHLCMHISCHQRHISCHQRHIKCHQLQKRANSIQDLASSSYMCCYNGNVQNLDLCVRTRRSCQKIQIWSSRWVMAQQSVHPKTVTIDRRLGGTLLSGRIFVCLGSGRLLLRFCMFWILLVNWNVGDTGLGISGVDHFALSLPVSGTFLPSHPVIHLPDREHIENIQTMRARACPGNFRSIGEPMQWNLDLFES